MNGRNLVLVCYPNWAGGKFLINCLGLSINATLQDNRIAKKDLSNCLTSTDKFNLLTRRVSFHNPINQWGDIELGCYQLLNTTFNKFDEILIDMDLLQKLNDSDKLFFMVAHNQFQYDECHKNFTDFKTIRLINTKRFIDRRGYGGYGGYGGNAISVWNDLRGDNWPGSPINIQELKNSTLSNSIKDEIKNKFLMYHDVSFFDNFTDKFDFTWDTNNYFSEDLTVEEIRKLYEFLNFTDFNEDFIRQFYRLWIKAVLPTEDK
jgi:hypothetical protein